MALGDVWTFISDNPEEASQIFLSLALVVATAAYTHSSYKQRDEMEKTRETSNQPVVKGGVDLMFSGHLVAVIKNTGNGAAHNVSAKIDFEDIDCEPIEFRTSILSPGEEYEVGFPLDKDSGFVTGMGRIENEIEDSHSDGILVVQSHCENVFGKSYSYTTRTDVLDVKENLSQIIRKSEQEKIRRAVEDIESNLGDIEKSIHQEYQDEKAHQELYQQVQQSIKSSGGIEVDELKSTTGIKKDRTFYGILNRLKQAGQIDFPEDQPLMFQEDAYVDWVGDVDKQTDSTA